MAEKYFANALEEDLVEVKRQYISIKTTRDYIKLDFKI